MEHMGEYLERKYYDELPLKQIKAEIEKMHDDYVKERGKRHTQSEIDDLTVRIDVLAQVLKLFP